MKTVYHKGILCLSVSALLSFAFSGAVLFGQGADIQYEIRYVEKQETYYFKTDLDWEPSQLDVVKMLPVTVRDSVVKQVFTTNDIKTTIHHLENSQTEEWMDMPAKTVMDRNKLRTYDAVNTLLMDVPNSDAYIESYNRLKDTLTLTSGSIIPKFPKLTNKLLNEFLYNGYSMANLGGGNIQFTKDSLTTIINNKKLTVEHRVSDAEGNTIYFEKRGFIKKSTGSIVPGFLLERKQDLRFTPGLVYRIDITTYQDYEIDLGGGLRMAMPDIEPALTIYPNPVANNLHAEWDTPIGQSTEIEVFNTTGRTMYKQTMGEERHCDIDVSGWASGMYIVRISNEFLCTQKNIVKL